jgi:carbon-monoxide dehydrogenase medium subunit
MKPFQYTRPETMGQVLSLLSEYGADASLLAGGTDLLVRLRKGKTPPRLVIDLKRVAQLSADITEEGPVMRIGALAILADLIEDERVRLHFPALVEAAGKIGSVQIRNRATLAGNICNASPAADTAPALLVYGASVNIAGISNSRRVGVGEFFTAPGKTVLQRGEMVASIDLPLPVERVGAAFVRLTRRQGVDLASASTCCLVKPSGVTLFAYGAVSPRPFLVSDESGILSDPQASQGAKDVVLRRLAAHASPITDVRASREYRQAMLLVLSRRALQLALGRLNRNYSHPHPEE